MKQWRADLRGEVELGDGFFDKLRIRAGFADYKHTEFEGDEIGTAFTNQGVEGRRAVDRHRQHVVALVEDVLLRSEEHTSELQPLMRISYADFCLKQKTPQRRRQQHHSVQSSAR